VTASADESTAWAAALGGDSRAFASLFDLHYDRVFRRVTGMTEQRADADEVCGAALLELRRNRARVRLVSGSVLPWLLVTASNLARNHGRKAQRYRRVLSALPYDLDVRDAGTHLLNLDAFDRRP
jgi:RNA polymerase sigma-70 factor (ECF subfamily)